jgi:hypothetical protein
MTEYELFDLMLTAVDGGTAVIGIILTVVSGYLIVAWLVGGKLTTAQVMMVNLLFLCTAPMMVWGWLGRYLAALDLQNQLLVLAPQTTERINMYVIIGFPIILFILILGSLKFMWDIRHPKIK